MLIPFVIMYLKKAYWCGNNMLDEMVNFNDHSDIDTFEPDPVDLTIGIQISHLRKVYHNVLLYYL